ncbi:hypothetical protein GPECTOR_23g15 [Gonium pectorale]|uniref:Uncharacterized protein n=1 Tax=Gonium pectorale TaxID=33097 RepID=A0A150GGW6_GONPE|nr:hypothetical protein GPECTOR_23g15 [Gonium pectorale]|eukprot:KXZ49064.1 hypothetical protein GPECTOR_23g15 [Gonium pectorale]
MAARRYAPYPEVAHASEGLPRSQQLGGLDRAHLLGSLLLPRGAADNGSDGNNSRDLDREQDLRAGLESFLKPALRQGGQGQGQGTAEVSEQEMHKQLLIDILQKVVKNGGTIGSAGNELLATMSSIVLSGGSLPPSAVRMLLAELDKDRELDCSVGTGGGGGGGLPPLQLQAGGGGNGNALRPAGHRSPVLVAAEELLSAPGVAAGDGLHSDFGDAEGAGGRLRLLATLATTAGDPRGGGGAAAGRGRFTRAAGSWEEEDAGQGGAVQQQQQQLPNGSRLVPNWQAAAWAAAMAAARGQGMTAADFAALQQPREELPPSLPLTVLHTDRKCPKLLAPRSGRVGDVKHVVLPAEISTALPPSVQDGEEAVTVRAVLFAPYAPKGTPQWSCDIPCLIGNGPGGFPALHLPVPEQLYGRPVRRFTLREDLVLELELGEVAVRPRVSDGSVAASGLGLGALGGSAAAAAVEAADEASGANGFADGMGAATAAAQAQALALLRAQAQAAGNGRAGVLPASAAAMAMMLAARLQAAGVPLPLAAGGLILPAAAGSSSCRSPRGGDLTADHSEPAAAPHAEGDSGLRVYGGGGGGDVAPAPELPVMVRRPRDGKPTVMRACTGAVGSKKHLPLPSDILRALPQLQRGGGIESVRVGAVYLPEGAPLPEAGGAVRGAVEERLVCAVGPSGSHGCMALQVPITERMNGRRLLYITLHTDYSIELGLGEIIAAPGGGQKSRGAAAAAAAAEATVISGENTEADDSNRQSPRRRPRDDFAAASVGAAGAVAATPMLAVIAGGAGKDGAPASFSAAAAAMAALAAAAAAAAGANVANSAPPAKRRRSSSSGPQEAAAALATTAAAVPTTEMDFVSSSARGSCDGNKERGESAGGAPPLLEPLAAAAAVGAAPAPRQLATLGRTDAAALLLTARTPAQAVTDGAAAAAAPRASADGGADANAAAVATLGRVWGLLQHVPRAQLAAAKALSAARQRRMSAAASPDASADASASSEYTSVLADFRGCLGSVLSLLLQAREAAAADAARQQCVLPDGAVASLATSDPRVIRCLLGAAPLMLHAAECLVDWYEMLLAAAADGEAEAAAIAGELGGSAALVRSQLQEALAGLPPPQAPLAQ